ncbi:hypothetical protein LTR50_006846 [Elasticomyces elasticus]|nr:hypothetical protein LTR50_006846 [Elasticomyces elasticus]
MSHAQSATSTDHAPTAINRRPSQKGWHKAGPSNIALLLANLHLLGLDQLEDWPGITEQIFDQKDAQYNQTKRIRCVEWALFRLFDLYEPKITRDKLQPFFPPLEPLQSLNLRAALYRCLNELKKNGVLEKEAVLRKTMLDECKGERFEEMLFVFSTVVLRKHLSARKSRRNQPVAEKLGLAVSLQPEQQRSLLPLAIAHKNALQRVLQRREHARASYNSAAHVFNVERCELQQRLERVKSHRLGAKLPINAEAIKKQVCDNWLGDTETRDLLLHGRKANTDESVSYSGFDEVWENIQLGLPPLQRGSFVTVLDDLESRHNTQSQRLRRWKSHVMRPKRESFANGPTHQRIGQAKPVRDTPSFRFDAHQHLRSIHRPLSNDMTVQGTTPAEEGTSTYSDIVAQMRADLSSVGRARKRNPDYSRPFLHTSPPQQLLSGPVQMPLDESFKQRLEPTRRSIPALDALLSPVKRPIAPTDSPLHTELQRKPAVWGHPADLGGQLADKETTFPVASHARSPIAQGTPRARSSSHLMSRDEKHETNCTPSNDVVVDYQGSKHAEGADAHNKSAFQAPSAPGLSLAERAQMSMAFANKDQSLLDQPTKPTIPKIPDAEVGAQQPAAPIDRRVSLADRTMQSMSLFPTKQEKHAAAKSKHRRTRSSLYPTNQFEAPPKARRPLSTLIRADSGSNTTDLPSNGDGNLFEKGRRDVTPHEKLFSEDAEYASVFKSRPKIALSPVVSPRDNKGRSSVDGMVALNGRREGLGSSPLASGRGLGR